MSTWERGGKAAEGKEWLTHQKPEELFVQVVSTLFGLEMSVNYNDRVIAPYMYVYLLWLKPNMCQPTTSSVTTIIAQDLY